MSAHPAFRAGGLAVITGAGHGGIGFAFASHLATQYKMKLALADISSTSLSKSASELQKLGVPSEDVLTHETDVSSIESIQTFKQAAKEKFASGGGGGGGGGGELKVDVLHLNAGVGDKAGPWDNYENWQKVLGVNLWGVVNGIQVFVEENMVKTDGPGAVIITGSKQGITMPPGNSAYNVSKAAVKATAEALSHQLVQTTQSRITAHLLVPGYTFTKLTNPSSNPTKPDAAWTPEQVVQVLVERMAKGDFYIICEDGEVTWDVDRARMEWSMGDPIENRPALSRWHPDYKEQFEKHMKERTGK